LELLGAAAPADPNAPGVPASSVAKSYILGDSITVQGEGAYKNMFNRQGVSTTISAVTGRSWTTPGSGQSVGTTGTGKSAVAADAAKIAEATVIVVALGTNGGLSANPPDEVVADIRAHNATAPIYWVNIAGTHQNVAPNVEAFNQKLFDLDTAGQINVVPWASVVNPGGPGTQDPEGFLSDGIHPTSAGLIKLIDAVEFTFASLQGINPGDCSGYAAGNGGDPSNCPPDTFFNQTTFRGVGSANELCVKSVQQARSPEAGKAIMWAFHHVGIPYGRPDGVCSTNTTRDLGRATMTVLDL
jgi:lysophospholipase L1-like esterase